MSASGAMLFDQMRAVVLEDHRLEGGSVVENPEFLRFAAHWQFRARACRAYRAKTKGEIERPIRYLRENFFYGRQLLNDADLDAPAQRRLSDVTNVRQHATTIEGPLERFEREEKGLLHPPAPRPCRSLVLAPAALPAPRPSRAPRIEVQRRTLEPCSQLAGSSG